jgi:hypothetical protein
MGFLFTIAEGRRISGISRVSVNTYYLESGALMAIIHYHTRTSAYYSA